MKGAELSLWTLDRHEERSVSARSGGLALRRCAAVECLAQWDDAARRAFHCVSSCFTRAHCTPCDTTKIAKQHAAGCAEWSCIKPLYVRFIFLVMHLLCDFVVDVIVKEQSIFLGCCHPAEEMASLVC